jgi:hypothetical protein
MNLEASTYQITQEEKHIFAIAIQKLSQSKTNPSPSSLLFYTPVETSMSQAMALVTNRRRKKTPSTTTITT